MKPLFIFLALLTASISAQSNWNTINDTATLWITDTTTINYTPWFILTDARHCRLVAMGKDTSTAAFSTDSTKIVYGFQTAGLVMNSNGKRDTAPDVRIRIDTLNSKSIIAATYAGTVDSAGTYARQYGTCDTTSVTGFLYQSRNFSPEWDVLIRYWAQAKTGNKLGSAVEMRMQNLRALFDYSRNR